MNLSIKVFLVLLLSVAVISSSAQINTSNLDSIPFIKAKKMSNVYEFNHPALTWARFSSPKAEKVDQGRYTTKEAAKDFGADIAEAFFGGFWETTTSREMNWLITGQIVCEHDWLNWDIELYCSGELHKEKVREENMDGSKSVNTIKTIVVDWQGSVNGFLTENEKTIGQFLIISRPRSDSLFYNANKDVFNETKTILKSVYKNKYYTEALNRNLNEYAVVGKFRDERFVLIANGVSRNMWFFINDNLVCVFQPDLDDLLIRKKDRIMPYILVDGQVSDTELVDWYRLALVSKYLGRTIGKASFPK
ncbi:MAG: hypothetical protein DRI71_10745 [Bacteroidetes bacterium]|nr:MAG: hypothetical protein DRI71_10745 [Bacteroidota bacterium]